MEQKYRPYQLHFQDQSAKYTPAENKVRVFTQWIHHLIHCRWQGPNEVFVSGLCAFHDKRGTPLKIVPKVDGRDLDLFKLFLTVVKMGGMQEVTRRDLWKSIADELRVSDSNHRATSALRGHYYKYAHLYRLFITPLQSSIPV